MISDTVRIALRGGIVITGGGSGIGRAVALGCAQAGADIAVLDLNAPAADSVAQEARERNGVKALGLQCNVRDESSVTAALISAVRCVGPLSGLVTSAGVDRGGLVHEMELSRWNEVVETNLTGTFLACKHFLRAMLDRGSAGSIVCISSPWGEVSAPGGVSAYSASKGGVSALVRSLALDYARYSIRVNTLVPGATETPLMWANVPAAGVADARTRICEQLAVGRLAEPREIANGAVWLLSDQASYVTGSQLVVDGGLLARGSIES